MKRGRVHKRRRRNSGETNNSMKISFGFCMIVQLKRRSGRIENDKEMDRQKKRD